MCSFTDKSSSCDDTVKPEDVLVTFEAFFKSNSKSEIQRDHNSSNFVVKTTEQQHPNAEEPNFQPGFGVIVMLCIVFLGVLVLLIIAIQAYKNIE